jgi:Zn-dependent protease with chaperone function
MLLRLRVVFALVFAVLFYAVALATAAALAWAGVQLGLSLTHFRGRIIIAIAVGALAFIAAAAVVLWSLLPRWSRFVPPGPELSRERHPKLFREVERVAALTGEAPPMHVYLVPEVNAFVAQRGGVMGLFSHRVMGIGLPLLSNLTVAQLRSVLAHEFGHYAGGDVKLLPWINKARAAMIGSVENLSSAAGSASGSDLAIATLIFSVVQAPFLFAAKRYLRFTQALSRAQEIAADALAVRIAGSQTHIEALTLTHRAGRAFGTFMHQDVHPLLAQGQLPPLAQGFAAFLSAREVREALDSLTPPETTDPYDSHPTLDERLAHARALRLPGSRRPDDDAPALSLLADVATCELELFQWATERADLKAVTWEASGDSLVSGWRRDFEAKREAFAGRTLMDPPRTGPDVRALLQANGFEGFASPDEVLLAFAFRVTWLGCALALVDSGATVINQPGEPLRLRLDGQTVDPGELIRQLHAEGGSATAWAETWAQVGLVDRPFAETSGASEDGGAAATDGA